MPSAPQLPDNQNSPNLKHALMLSGATAAMMSLGLPGVEVFAPMLDGLNHVLGASPLSAPLALSNNYFSGALLWTGSLAMQAADCFVEHGGVIGDHITSSLISIQERVAAISSTTGEAARASMANTQQLSLLVRSSVKDVTSPVIDAAQSGLSAVIAKPVEAADAVGNVLLKAVECFGAIKGLQEAWTWSIGRFSKKKKASAEVQKTSAETGLSAQAVTNLTINISLGGETSADKAAEQIAAALGKGDGSVIVEPDRVREMLDAAERKAAADRAAAIRERQIEKATALFLADKGPIYRDTPRTGLNHTDIISTAEEANAQINSALSKRFRIPEHLIAEKLAIAVNKPACDGIICRRSTEDKVYSRAAKIDIGRKLAKNAIDGNGIKADNCENDNCPAMM